MPATANPCLLALGASNSTAMRTQLAELAALADSGEGWAGVAEAAVRLHRELLVGQPLRCAIVASAPEHVSAGVWDAAQILDGTGLRARGRAFVGSGRRLRIGLLFPGQGAPAVTEVGALAERFPSTATTFARAALPDGLEAVPDELVQLSVVASSLAGLEVLRTLGGEAEIAVGHSLGELVALHWAGAIDEEALLRIVRARGAAMTSHAAARGAMATVRGDRRALATLIRNTSLTVACHNSPRQWVVSGDVAAVESFLQRAKASRVRAKQLRVVGAFHSPLMVPALPAFRRSLVGVRFAPVRRPVVSTVTGATLAEATDLRDLLLRQVVSPVRFAEAAAIVAAEVDLLVEVGPGRTLAPLAAEIAEVPVVSTRIGASSAGALTETAAALFAVGKLTTAEQFLPATSGRAVL